MLQKNLRELFGQTNTYSSSAGKESACNAGDPSLISGSGRPAGEGICYPLQYSWASLVAQLVKNPPAFDLWVGKIPWRREQLPTPVFWPGESHGQYDPWGRKESDTTEWLSLFVTILSMPCHACLTWVTISTHAPSPKLMLLEPDSAQLLSLPLSHVSFTPEDPL